MLRILFVFAAFLLTSKALGQISSTFDTNAQGWTAPDANPGIQYSGTGGNPGGYVSGNPFVLVFGSVIFYAPFYFVAPTAYLGNRSIYYNGTLRYDIQQSSTGPPNLYAEVRITGGGITLFYFPGVPHQPPAPPGWTTYSIVLNNAASFWKTTDSPTGPPASETQIQTVLANLTNLQIRGLYRDANTNGRMDNVSFTPPIVITSQPGSTSVCQGVVATFTTAATGNPAITYRWQFESSPGVWTDLTNTGGYSNVTTATLSVNTAGNFGAGQYRCRISGTGVVDAFTNVATLTINAVPAPPTTTGASRCGPGPVTLTASGGTSGQYRWYTVPTGGTPLAGETNAAYTTPSLSATTSYYVAINNGACESTRTLVVATINPIPSAPATTGAARCGPGTVTLTASGGTPGQYRWYTVPTGGTALAGETNASYTTPSITATTTYYVAISNGLCESVRTPVVATLHPIPPAPTAGGAARCGTGALTLSAAGGTAGQYRWYTVPTGGTALAGETNATYTTPSLAATTTYYVAINNGICESGRTAVVATINLIPSLPITSGASRCGPGSVTLTASGGSAGEYRWYTVPTGGTAIAGETSNSYTTPSLSLTTSYYVAINNGSCEGNRAAVAATINSIPASPAATGAARCGAGTVTLSASGAAAGQYRWYTVPTGGSPLAGETAGTYSTPVLSITTTYYVAINNGACESNRTAVTATVNPVPAAPSTSGAARCGSGSVTLTASGGTAGQYRWYTVPTGGTAISGQTNSSYATPSLSATTNFFVAINNGTCESARTVVTATVNAIPPAPATTGDSRCGPGAVTLNATGGTAGQYRWYTVPTGGTAIAGAINSIFTTPSLSATTPYYVSIDNGLCEGSRTAVVATINSIPSAPATSGAGRCGDGPVTLSASGGTSGQYRWYTVATGGTALPGETGPAFTTPLLTTTTLYYVAINNGTCESVRTSVTATVNAIPAAPATAGANSCTPASVTLTASGGTPGQYRWYTTSTGGTPLTGQTNATFTTPVLSATTTYYAALFDGTCESARTPAIAVIAEPGCDNVPPVIESPALLAQIGGRLTLDLVPLISDANNNVVLSSLRIVDPPASGALATITSDYQLIIDYSLIIFTGIDNITLEVCDFFDACTQQTLTIEVVGEIVIYNALSPNQDGRNEIFLIEHITAFPSTRENKVSVYDRWGTLVWQGENYDNREVVFSGKTSGNRELPNGVYFYKVEFKGQKKPLTGFLEVKR